MQKWTVEQLGNPKEALVLRTNEERPIRKKGQVLIRTEAAALNFFDILLCQGTYQEKPALPFTPGSEIAGTVAEVGSNSRFRVNQRVIARPTMPAGGLAEWHAVEEESVFEVPKSMSFPEAASLFITYQTAYYALHHRANIKEGQTLLVHAGAGGVGSAAIQLGKAAGAYVIATAGGADKTKRCSELGADAVIDYRNDDFVPLVNKATGGRGADVIFDPVGGDTFDRSRKCIAFAGKLLVIGFAGGSISEAPMNHALVKNYSLIGVHWGYYAKLYPDGVKEIHKKLCGLYESGDVRPLLFKVYKMEEAIHALDQLSDRQTFGKLIIEMNRHY
ncbi:NADPH:quinone oxidoreductase family protein [Shouchella patagoniensis]|uniref:NADPH:quinone oxidoreductase family protein n=1 Tax=Shouchella patagoniensis TaxID=228576 RepID=UPI000994B266|nr:NADPH:quinone oxidoreductase family protein [Shouchella patagoniensis]